MHYGIGPLQILKGLATFPNLAFAPTDYIYIFVTTFIFLYHTQNNLLPCNIYSIFRKNFVHILYKT